MITEDYVSFETAKLLKEKGFYEVTPKWYLKYGEEYRLVARGTAAHTDSSIDVPTLQMAMKWLREVHRIDIEVRTHYLSYLKPNELRYYSGKILKGSEDVIQTIYSKDTYEEVCEEAIKYCLENLI